MTTCRVDRHVPLAPLTTLELGGSARHFVRATSEAEVVEAARLAARNDWPFFVLGGGSNVVFPDDGYDGLVLHIDLRAQTLDSDGVAQLGAGEPWAPFVDRAVEAGFAGVECLCGIPGSVGATPIQNVGAYGQEVAEVFVSLRAYDRETDRIVTMDRDACSFGYRNSLFKRTPGRFIVLSVKLALVPGGAPTVRYAELERSVREEPTLVEVRDAVLALRRKKSMVIDASDPNRRSAGSFFMNPILTDSAADEVQRRITEVGITDAMPRYAVGDGHSKLSAAWLIDRAKIPRGLRRGFVGVSSNHTLALVHHGGGTTAELLALADEVRGIVDAKFGVRLEPEPTIVVNQSIA